MNSDLESSALDRSSRILVLSRSGSSSQREAQNFIQSIIESSESSTQEFSASSPETVQEQDEDQDGSASFDVSVANLDDSTSIDPKPTQWRIDNRYYTATVHFLPRSLPKSIVGDSSEDQKKKGAAKRTLAENRALREAAKRKESEKAESKTADVFEALKSTEPDPDVKRLVVESEEIEAFQKEVEGVPAVVLLVKRDDSLQSHRDLLAKISPSLFGFDLEVSLVVGLPSTLQISDPFASSSSTPGKVASRPSYEDLVTLYAEQGWEYINLPSDLEDLESEDPSYMDNFTEEDQEIEINQDARELGIDKNILEFARRPSLDQVKAGAREEVGLDRVKEALETYLWPGLERKDDRAGRDERREENENRNVSRPVEFRSVDFSDWKSTLDDEDNGPIDGKWLPKQQPLSQSQDLDLDSHTSTDEALAKAFLSKLGLDQAHLSSNLPEMNASFGFGTREEEDALRSGALKPPGSESKIWKELEDFLKDEDPDWPIGKGKTKENEEIGISQLDKEIFAELANEAREREKKPKVQDDEEAWVVRASDIQQSTNTTSSEASKENSSRGVAEAFDDDFADFVSASTTTSTLEPKDEAFEDDFPTPAEILATKASIFGSTPSSASKSKLKSTSTSGETQAEDGFEFGQAMLAIQAHAERVRSIQDPEERRREAARIALAVGMGLDGDEGED